MSIDRPLISLIGAGSLLALLAGCASVQPQLRMDEVKSQVGERIDQQIAWHQGAADSQHTEAMVKTLLQDGMSANEAVQIALINSPGLQGVYERLGIVQADLVQAGLIENPTLSLQYLFGDDGDIFEGAIVQEFVGVFTLSARRKIGAAGARQATLEVSQAVTDRAAEVRAAYFSVVADAQSLELLEQVTDATAAGAELAARQYAAGTLAERDQLAQQAFYAQTIAEAARAEVQLAADRERVNRLLGLSGELTQWTMPGRLPELPAQLPPLEGLEAAAVSQRLDLAAANAEVEALARVSGLTRSTRWLSFLGVGVAYKREPGDEKFFGPEVELALPLFDQGQVRVARAQAEFRTAERRLEQLAVDIRSEAREARLRLQSAYQLARHYKEALLPLQQRLVEETTKFYNGMLIGAYDLLLARQQQIQVARDYIGATKDFWVAWADLERAVGGRIDLTEVGGSHKDASAPPAPRSDHSKH